MQLRFRNPYFNRKCKFILTRNLSSLLSLYKGDISPKNGHLLLIEKIIQEVAKIMPRDIRAELPALQRLLRPGPDLAVEVHHLRVRRGQVRHVLEHQPPDQVVVEAGPVRRRHDDGNVGGVLRRHDNDGGVLRDLGVGVAGLQHLQPGDVDRHRPQLLHLNQQEKV
jgi:hypothetical protein